MNVYPTLLFALLAVCDGAIAQEQRTFHDDLLNHLVGKWNVTGTVHGNASRQIIEANWVLNHQFLRVTERTIENVEGETYPYEGVYYVGYDKTGNRYVVHLMSVWGADADALGIGRRIDNTIRVVFPYNYGSIANDFIWQPESLQWRILIKGEKSNEQPYVDLVLTKIGSLNGGARNVSPPNNRIERTRER